MADCQRLCVHQHRLGWRPNICTFMVLCVHVCMCVYLYVCIVFVCVHVSVYVCVLCVHVFVHVCVSSTTNGCVEFVKWYCAVR